MSAGIARKFRITFEFAHSYMLMSYGLDLYHRVVLLGIQ